MPEAVNEPTTGDPSETETTTNNEPLEDPGKRALEAERQARRQAEKSHRDAMKEIEEFRRQSMTDQEKAVADAVAEARKSAMVELGSRIVAAEFKAAAAGRLTETQLSTLLAALDVTPFVNDDGEADIAKIGSFLDGIAPKHEEPAPAGFPDLGQGARNTPALNGDPLLRDLKLKLGVT
jgi:hypothetical protein